MRVFITGITGPVGSALAEYLLTLPGVEVHAFKRWRSDTRSIANVKDRIILHEGDIEDAYSVEKAVIRAKPDRVYHLAAQSYPSESWDAPITTFRVNVEGTINVLEAVRRHCSEARVHVAGTSAQYGWVNADETPIAESHAMRPASPYGVSKVAAELTALQYHDSYGLHTVVTRSFNHIGPYQGDRCSIQTFCQQMAAIEAGLMEPTIKVGNLETRRDFSHTADVARALWLLLDRGEAGQVYNLCSGEATRIGDIVDLVREQGTVRTEIAVDPSRIRPSDEPILMGDNGKLKAATGWEPAISIEEIVAEILSYWRGRTGESIAAQRPPLKAVRAAQG
jgi:GDP-4-dehydro-6-deoxy-D-mannose reductase